MADGGSLVTPVYAGKLSAERRADRRTLLRVSGRFLADVEQSDDP